jgi:hypothetical protein
MKRLHSRARLLSRAVSGCHRKMTSLRVSGKPISTLEHALYAFGERLATQFNVVFFWVYLPARASAR